jgi:DNA-binding NarL/FixJ family response regulator
VSRLEDSRLRQSPEEGPEDEAPPVSDPTRVLIVSPVCLYREGLAMLLGGYPSVEVVGAADGAASLIESGRLEADAPDVVLVDMMAPGGEQEIALLRSASDAPALLGMTVPNREDSVFGLVEAGASGFVTVDASPDELVAGIECAARSEAICSPPMTAALIRRLAALARDREPDPVRAALTAREREIVSLIEEGLSNKQIAYRLRIQLSTVKNHVHHILGKLGLERRAQVVALARARARR